jgi:phytoene dehydrogenase-like protein
MSNCNSKSYDVVIVGAGISGLVCGCYLAKAGMKVLIVEQHDKPGGYFTSFKRKGFLFDAAAHSFGNYREGGHVRKILTEIGVNQLITIKRFDPSDVIIAPDFKLTFWNEAKATIAGLAGIFPAEKDNVIRFFNFLTSATQSEIITLKNKTFSTFLHSFFKDEKLMSAFSLPVFGNGGLPPSLMHAFSGSKIFSEFVLDGGYYPEGGIQHLPNALDQIIRQHHGDITYRKLVKKIILENNRIAGIELNNGETVASRYVVSACDVTQTFNTLLGGKGVDERMAGSLDALIPSLSTFILYLGIDGPFVGLPQPGTNTWYLPHYDLDDMYGHIQKCDFNKAGMYMLRVSPDQKTILAFIGAPFQTSLFWKQNKKTVADDFLTRIEALIPDLRKHIVYSDAATPTTLHRYTLNNQGAAFGWAKTPAQTFDPVLCKTTSIDGLYLTGHWTSIAFGMPGTCYSGHDTAKRILRKEKKR